MLQLHEGLKYAMLSMNYCGGSMNKNFTDGSIIAFVITSACVITFILCAVLNLV